MPGDPNGDKRLLVVTESVGIGGTESHLIRVLCPLAARGWSTTVYCITDRGRRADQLEAAGIRVIGPPCVSFRALSRRDPATIALAANRLFWLLRQLRPQIVHFYLPGPYIVGAPLAIATGVPIKIMSRRSLSAYRRRRPLVARIELALHRHMDAVIGNSRAVVTQLQSEGISSNKIHLIYNGIETPAILPDRLEARRQLGLDPGAVVGLVVANLISYKGHTDLINALGQVSEGLPTGWRMLCAGRDQGLRLKLEALASARGIAANVSFLGEKTNVPVLLAAADFSVLCSWEEGFSNVILESMAARLPMVVTNVGGNPEAVLDGETGFVVPPHDPAALAQALLLLGCDPGLRDRFGEAGEKRAKREFAIERCVDSHNALYHELLACRR
jgi:glycosyltransferase involved in cell wall biosynthesis